MLGGHRLVGWWGIGVTVGSGALAGWHQQGDCCALGGRRRPPSVTRGVLVLASAGRWQQHVGGKAFEQGISGGVVK